MTKAAPDYRTTLGDTLLIQAALNDAAGTQFSLANATVTFHLRHAASGAIIVAGAGAAIVDPIARIVSYESNPVLPGAGLYLGQFHVAFADGSIATFPRPAPLLIEVADPA